MTEFIWPEIGSKWQDRKYPSRTLTVQEVNPKDRLGRNIVGVVDWSGDVTRDYACDVLVFQAIWEPAFPKQ